MNSFSEHYELHRSIEDVAEKFLKSPENKTCRFCGKAYPELFFQTIPHIIPELFGRNNWTSNFECDECNKRFQRVETDMSTMIQHYLSILRIKTKKGVPTFQSFKRSDEYSTFIKLIGEKLHINFGANVDDFKYDEENNSISLFLRTRKFRPFSIYKTFLKIGISLLSHEELATNDHYLPFLNSVEPINDGRQFWTCFRQILKTSYFPTPKANLYKAKNTIVGETEFPEYILIVYFSNVVFQFFLPISKQNMNEHSSSNKLVIEIFPAFALENIQKLSSIELQYFDLNEINPIYIVDTITLFYDRLEKDIYKTNEKEV